jgi:hypothetical protein
VRPDTTPPVLTEPTAGLLLLHVPPLVPSESGVVEPIHTAGVPVMGDGEGCTVTVTLVLQPVGSV